ncbi:glycosyltransferase family 2 protein [Streptococcus dysgalactiae]|uniref:Glycosyltransferase family 2 protein n=1 Tax=Streptococcus dysgalactiae TaxID=1334 RepID=A0AAE9UKW2_STRDY|nr:glycosyltransferase family 2 protein [Streptococcus dysgalactiae]WAI92442.1 glycosyltransferase family 2 protein [Streptococcus dysgalactiae]BBE40680.1 poly-beta-1,6-N-acetyl-D-glucosamine synthase [Streptococcus dysgalactiae]
MQLFFTFLQLSQLIFLLLLIAYASFLVISLVIGGVHLYEKREHRSRLATHADDVGVSVIVPAYNEALTIVNTIDSLLHLDYDHYEIIVVDDGSSDQTSMVLMNHFPLILHQEPINQHIVTKPYKAIYKSDVEGVVLTLIVKENGGKGDALNMGINASCHDYFLCLDADSMLQKDSLKHIVTSVRLDKTVIAVGGLVQVAQGVKIEEGRVVSYHLPWRMVPCAQAIEYDSSFLGARIFLDYLKANLIISGAFGLFKKDIVKAVGGYDTETLGEDMELVMKLHFFCRNNQVPYRICYETDAVCWSQAPTSLGDLRKQRRRWFLGLYQCLKKYRSVFANYRFGAVGFVSYIYYIFFELISPFLELFGAGVVFLALIFHQLNIPFFFSLIFLYTLYCILITLTSFLHRIYSQKLMIGVTDIIKVMYIAVFRYLVLHPVLTLVKASSIIGYREKKNIWGQLKREIQMQEYDNLLS